MRVAPEVILSPEERARLGRWSRTARGRGSRAVRARLVLLAAEGRQDVEIGRRLGLDRRTVGRWRHRFLSGRLRGLDDSPGTVVRGRIPEERLQAIVRATVARAPPAGPTWSTRSLAREYGVSHMTVQRVWDRFRVRPVRRGSGSPRTDPVPPGRPWDIVGLYLKPPFASVAVTLRPGTGPHDTGAGSPADSNRVHGGGGEQILAAFRSLKSFESRTEPSEPRMEDYIRFLAGVERLVEGRSRVRVVALAPGGARSPTLNRWRVRHPGIEVALHPDFPHWQRQAVETLRDAGRREGGPSQGRGPAETARSVARSLLAYEEGRGPLVWLSTPDEFRRGEAAHRLRYDLAVTGQSALKSPSSMDGPMTLERTAPDTVERAMARSVLRRYLGLRRGDRLTVETWTGTLPYANALVLEALRIGARPLVLYQDEATYWAATEEVTPRHLAVIGEHRRSALERSDAFVTFFGPSDRERYHALPPATMAKLCAFEEAMDRAVERAGARAVQMAIGRVSTASARMYGVDETAWRSELVSASLVDPATLRRRGKRLYSALRTGQELEIRHPNGTQLALRLRGYVPLLTDGAVRRPGTRGAWGTVLLPAGVVGVAVDERYAEGTFRSNLPSSVGLSGAVGEMAGARWTFRDGRLASYAYDSGGELFRQSYDRAPAGRDRPASVSIGLNEHLRISPLLEDQGLGTVTMHLGRNEPLGGRTRCDWWAWSYLTGGDVRVDGRTFVRRGHLVA